MGIGISECLKGTCTCCSHDEPRRTTPPVEKPAEPSPKVQLLLGCGSSRENRFDQGWEKLVTLDNVERHSPDFLFDLEAVSRFPTVQTPFAGDTFDEIHAYEVLEHVTGQQGDAPAFFRFFTELWRVLKPGGRIYATVPHWQGIWAWSDPSHSRIISPGTLVFLDQNEYKLQIGKTPMSDYRDIYRADFLRDSMAYTKTNAGELEGFHFILRAVKPSRWEP